MTRQFQHTYEGSKPEAMDFGRGWLRKFQHTYEGSKLIYHVSTILTSLGSSIPTRVRNRTVFPKEFGNEYVPAYLRGFETRRDFLIGRIPGRVLAYLRGFETG